MINKPSDFARALNNGPFAWPGGYPTFFITSDGAALCHGCGEKEGRRVTDSLRTQTHDGWLVQAQDINWEDEELYCDHCGKRIPSAYGDDKEEGAADCYTARPRKTAAD